MPRSKHYYDVAEPRRKATEGGGEKPRRKYDSDDGGGDEKGGDSLLSLSLGDIYRNNAPAPAAKAKADAGGGFRSPAVTPMVWAPLRPADAPRALCAAVAVVHPPLRLDIDDALVVGAEGGGFFPAASGAAPMLSDMASSDDGRRVVVSAPVVHADVTAAAPRKRPAKRSRSVRSRSSATTNLLPAVDANADENVKIGGGLHICPPYQWSTERVGVHHSLAELSERGIDTITGELQCKRCDDIRVVALDVKAKFKDLCGYISCNIHGMDDRAPQRWKEPALPDCDKCGQRGSMRPVIPADKHRINWVFLLLSEMLGMCTLEQLKHFCEHTQQHRTGAKDRVLYLTYMELCNQLLPSGPFDMEVVRRKRTRPNA